MNKNEILLRKARKVLVPTIHGEANASDPRVMTLQAELMRLGFMMDQELCEALSLLNDKRFEQTFRQTVKICKQLVGDDVKYEPMYPNFPRQVMEMDEAELYFNAILHYWSFGRWMPEFEVEDRTPAFEKINYKMLGRGTAIEVIDVARGILASNGSVTDTDRDIVEWVMDEYTEDTLVDKIIPEDIPFKENLCWFAARCIEKDKQAVGIESLKTATDILRLATSMSGGDITLAENTRFKSFGRPMRRALVGRLDEVVNDDDLFRHRGKWIRLAHSLHVGDYSGKGFPAFDSVQRLRDRDHKHLSFDGKVDAAIESCDYSTLIELLLSRPGVFARRLDHVLRLFDQRQDATVGHFLSVAEVVDSRVLMQLYGHFNGRAEGLEERLVFPKGQTSKAILLRDKLPELDKDLVNDLLDGIQEVLESKFAQLDNLGAVYVDERLKGCPIPLSLRSASEGLHTVARGTRMPLGDKDTLRMFIYWKGMDIDLSATLLKEDFSHHSDIAYYNLREGDIGCHSGDITRAPNGAAEFIDLNLDKIRRKHKARYVAMQVYVYSGPNLADHEICYAGWMMRDKPDANDVFKPDTVDQRVDLTANSRTAIPVIFDLETREAIWLDVATGNTRNHFGGINAASNRAQVTDIIRGSVNLVNKPTLYDLFVMHANVRGDHFVENPEDADTVFSFDGDVTPFDTTRILSEFL